MPHVTFNAEIQTLTDSSLGAFTISKKSKLCGLLFNSPSEYQYKSRGLMMAVFKMGQDLGDPAYVEGPYLVLYNGVNEMVMDKSMFDSPPTSITANPIWLEE